jgi:uncharacterized membrane protein
MDQVQLVLSGAFFIVAIGSLFDSKHGKKSYYTYSVAMAALGIKSYLVYINKYSLIQLILICISTLFLVINLYIFLKNKKDQSKQQ